jgi:hypothetical protein
MLPLTVGPAGAAVGWGAAELLDAGGLGASVGVAHATTKIASAISVSNVIFFILNFSSMSFGSDVDVKPFATIGSDYTTSFIDRVSIVA